MERAGIHPGAGGEGWGRGPGLGLPGVSPRRTKPWFSGLPCVQGRMKENLVLLPILEQRRLRGHRSPSRLSLPSGAEPADV